MWWRLARFAARSCRGFFVAHEAGCPWKWLKVTKKVTFGASPKVTQKWPQKWRFEPPKWLKSHVFGWKSHFGVTFESLCFSHFLVTFLKVASLVTFESFSWAASTHRVRWKTLCNFEPQIWLEMIASRGARSACFKGSRTFCNVVISGVSLGLFGRKRSHHVMDVSCWVCARHPEEWEGSTESDRPGSESACCMWHVLAAWYGSRVSSGMGVWCPPALSSSRAQQQLLLSGLEAPSDHGRLWPSTPNKLEYHYTQNDYRTELYYFRIFFLVIPARWLPNRFVSEINSSRLAVRAEVSPNPLPNCFGNSLR